MRAEPGGVLRAVRRGGAAQRAGRGDPRADCAPDDKRLRQVPGGARTDPARPRDSGAISRGRLHARARCEPPAPGDRRRPDRDLERLLVLCVREAGVSDLTMSATTPHRHQRMRMTFAVIRRAASDARNATTSATSSGFTTWRSSSLSATAASTSGEIHPVSVTGGWTTLAVTPHAASSNAADIVKFSSAAFAAPYETSSGKPSGPPEVRPMIRPHVAPRSTWRLANSAISKAVALASTANTASIVLAETGRSPRPRRSEAACPKVSGVQPEALLTRTSTGPYRSSAASNRADGVP